MAATPLTTDLYELTMMAGYFVQERHERTIASFELFVRRLPPHRNYLVAAGLASLLEYLEQLRFSDDEIAWLRRSDALANVPEAFFDYLKTFRFTGDVWAVPEGTPVFAHEPIVRVTAPIAQAQLVETAALAFITFQTSVASKAARVVAAAAGRPIMEFGARRAHGLEAALFAARSAYLAGAAGTSFVEAGRRFGIPLSGTMAHSWIMSAESEAQAFADYCRLFGDHSTLLLDTYDTVRAARLVVSSGLKPAAVRLDSGDLRSLSEQVRQILDAGGLTDTRILASGDLDEHSIASLVEAHAPIDGFGVGTRLVTSEDAPALGGVYKLVEIDDGGARRLVVKTSEGKATWPGRKQVWRVIRDGRAVRDVVSLADEPPVPDGTALLREMMRRGRTLDVDLSIASARQRFDALLAELPEGLRTLGDAVAYGVRPSAALAAATPPARSP
jgi:nicotinate phosphoribosyltransferase